MQKALTCKPCASVRTDREVYFGDRDRRAKSPASRLRRFVVWCVSDTNVDTIAVIVLSFQLVLMLAIFAFQSKVIEPPPPWFVAPLSIRLPAFWWIVFLALSLSWHGIAWTLTNLCQRRNASIFGAILLCVMAGSIALRGPGLATVILLMNAWQMIMAARLFDECRDAAKKAALLRKAGLKAR